MCVLISISFSLHPFSYDNAAYTAQNGKWKDAHEKLNNILVDAPDRADVLYDAGVAAHNLENFNEAAACFLRAAECTDDNNLRTRAHFNAGNALVAHKDLAGALEQYEKVLALDHLHEYARHNRDRVKQMLEEQKQEQQQQGDDQKDEQEEQKDKENEQQDKQNQSKNDKNDQQGNEQQKQGSNNDSSDNGSDQESEGEQGDEAESGSKDAQRKDHGNKKQHQDKSTDKQKRNGDQQLEDKSHDKNNKSDTTQGDKHKESPEKQLNSSDNGSVPSDDGQEQESSFAEVAEDLQKDFEQKINDKWLLSVLNNQEERDKAMNKQLMEAKINQHGGKDGQNCW